MKILLAVTSPVSYTLLKGQISYLKRNNFDPVLATSQITTIRKGVEEEGGRAVEINLEREISLFKDIKAIFSAIKILKAEKPDVINASTPKAGLIFMIAAFLFPRSCSVFTLRGLRHETLSGVKRKIVWFTEYLTCSLAKKVVVISPSLKDHAVQKGILQPEKAVVFGQGSSNGIDLNRFSADEKIKAEGRKIKTELGIPSDGFIFGYVGRIVQDKGLIELFQAFEKILKSDTNVYLVLTGSFEKEDPVPAPVLTKMKNNANVFFIEHTKHIEYVISMYDVMILYSYREGFGNVVLEASALNKPVIVADIPGLKDTTLNNVTGFVVEEKNPEALALKMENYLTDKRLRGIHGNNGRERVVKHFRSEIIWDHQVRLYNSLINNHRLTD